MNWEPYFFYLVMFDQYKKYCANFLLMKTRVVDYVKLYRYNGFD
uniref:Uncharacterized protein n=1 Tax=viral metagenome TaxID=1070528 RepID=A0A6C0EFT2_9ZZZZ